MKNYKLDVLGVSEMRWIGQGIVRKEDMTILYSGKEEHHSHSVGIIMNKKANKALTGWKPIDHRIITAQFQTQHSKVTIIQAYAPTEVATSEDKDTFYDKLQETYDNIPNYHVKLLLGDFNAQVDGDRQGYQSVLGPYGASPSRNENGERLVSFCCTNGICLGNTFFNHKSIHKRTWTSPDGNTEKELD